MKKLDKLNIVGKSFILPDLFKHIENEYYPYNKYVDFDTIDIANELSIIVKFKNSTNFKVITNTKNGISNILKVELYK